MAKLETAKYIASSLDNFIVFANNTYTQPPYITFTIPNSVVGSDVTITFEDAEDEDAAKIVLQGKNGSYITSRTFNTATSVEQVTYSLLECLKQLSIVYDTIPVGNNQVRAGMDTSRKWKVTSDKITVGGTYQSYNIESINKWVIMGVGEIDKETSNFTLEKYNNSEEVSFNVSQPFQLIASRYPFKMDLSAYLVNNNRIEKQTINNSTITVLPTTMSKFSYIDYDNDYLIEKAGNEKKRFLTTSTTKNYNYDEWIGLSVLTDYNMSEITLLKKYYTNSGMFLTSYNTVMRKDSHNDRVDFYDTFNINQVENAYNHQVGYIDVVCATTTGKELTETLRYYVQPSCETNDTFYFINSIGGLDSYSFTGKKEEEIKIDDNVTYKKNPTRPYTDVYELEYVRQKTMEHTYTSTSSMIDKAMALWLEELATSKYVFKYNHYDKVKDTMVIIDDLDIEVASDEKYYEIKAEWRYADSNIAV